MNLIKLICCHEFGVGCLAEKRMSCPPNGDIKLIIRVFGNMAGVILALFNFDREFRASLTIHGLTCGKAF